MLVIALLISIAILLGLLGFVIYLRYTENSRLDQMALNNLLTEEEKRYFIASYKKMLASKIVYESLAEKKFPIEVTREVIRESREEMGK